MANVNRVTLIGRLTRDPELRVFDNGGKVANIGFAVNNRRKNPQTGQWEEVPVWIELRAFNRESGRKLADLAEAHLRKGHQVYIEGRLSLDEWTGKEDGKKHSRTVVLVDNLEFLERKADALKDVGGQSNPAAAEPRELRDQALFGRREFEDVPF